MSNFRSTRAVYSSLLENETALVGDGLRIDGPDGSDYAVNVELVQFFGHGYAFTIERLFADPLLVSWEFDEGEGTLL